MFLYFLISCFVHLFLLKAVIDSYFRSIIELDLPLTNSTSKPAAKRVVLIVVDGLKASAVFERIDSYTPFLTYLRKNKASWGVSRGKAPTESRVGHVAIVAGFREDPRAIVSNFRQYPVRYDSVMEQSNHAWVFAGSDRMGTIFGKYATSNVEIFSPRPYTYTEKPIGDELTLSTFRKTFNDSKKTYNLTGSKNLIVVLLPDMDAYGHHHPENYSKALIDVDKKVQEISNIIEKTFKDDLTTFLFTSDHGMFKQGHGSNVEDCILTPFVAWGAGIEINTERKDVSNIDIAPLIAVLLGIHFPTNSYGKLPVAYLDADNTTKLQLISQNLIQILNIFKAKRERLSKNMLIERSILDIQGLEKTLAKFLEGNVQSFEESFKRCELMYNEILGAIDKVRFYFVCDILALSLIYLFFWILYLLLRLIPNNVKEKENRVLPAVLLVSFHAFILLMHCFFDIFPLLCVLPFGTFCICLTSIKKINSISKNILDFPPQSQMCVFFLFILSIFLALYLRSLLSYTVISMAPILFFEGQNLKEDKFRNVWFVLCLILSGFPLITPHIEWNMDGTNYYIIGSFIWHFLIGCIFRNFFDSSESSVLTKLQIIINSIQLFCSFSMSFVSFFQIKGHEDYVFYIGFIPIILIPFSMKMPDVRMVTIFMAFATVYMIEAKPFALIFLTFFTMFLLTWKIVETQHLKSRGFVNFRNFWILIGVSMLGFLGIINYWKINIPFTEPTIQLDLIYSFKLFTTMIFTGCIFNYIVSRTGVDQNFCFTCIEVFFSSMIFHFICIIQNEGSWSEIGLSFVRFNIVNFFPLATMFFSFISYFLMNIGSSDLFGKFYFILDCH
ncbi:GPI ethanolamine phosphate transferase 1-like [Coccinella septempunctata]|uniref:GPI ethanolamine phosphate transferase 1-like n=1 Tax=Coccinella septempunctata TaxID=41139 RepID=UPI001D0886BA|nr:GPI ethanolamine phosphate transferase 1-like [Coccinella septempunctata]